MTIDVKNRIASGLVILSAFILVNKLLLPTTIQIMVQGGSTTLKEIPNVYTIKDCIVIAVSSFLLGINIFYLLSIKSTPDLQLPITGNQTFLGNSVADSPILKDTELEFESENKPEKSSEKESERMKINYILNIFKGNEQRVIKELYSTKEITQAELATRIDIPKSTLSRILADLEKRDLVIRYENGMTKMVKLSDTLQEREY